MIGALLADILPYLIAAVAGVVGVWGYGAHKERKGRKAGREETYIEAKARDHEKAAEIRNRVERDLDGVVREFDDAGYRD